MPLLRQHVPQDRENLITPRTMYRISYSFIFNSLFYPQKLLSVSRWWKVGSHGNLWQNSDLGAHRLSGCSKLWPVPKTFLSPGSLQLRSRSEGVSELKQEVEVWEGPAQLIVSANPIPVQVLLVYGKAPNSPPEAWRKMLSHLPPFWLSSVSENKFMGFSRQEHGRGLPFPYPVDPFFSEVSTMTHLSWVALYGLAHSFTELHKAVVHVIRLVNCL